MRVTMKQSTTHELEKGSKLVFDDKETYTVSDVVGKALIAKGSAVDADAKPEEPVAEPVPLTAHPDTKED